VKLPSTGRTVDVERPVALFATHILGIFGQSWHEYAVTRDGQRFLINTDPEGTPPISLILNWTPKP
jgi:hypothetical protein